MEEWKLDKNKMKLKYKKLNKLAKNPFKKHEGDACYDLHATSKKRIGLFKIEYGVGLAFEIPKNMRIDLKSRSSVHETGLMLSNGQGTIDEPYRGELKAVFYHILFWKKSYGVGDRILQMSLENVLPIEFEETKYLSETERGNGGYGSTGLK